MRRTATRRLIFAIPSAVLVIGALAAISAPDRSVCVARAADALGPNVGYELIDLMRREAWVTTDWTLEAYSELELGLTAFNWIKNDPREGSAARAAFLKSPGCDHDGEFTSRTLFGRTFTHVADISLLRGPGGTVGDVTGGGVIKYHRLAFDAGQTVSILLSPDGTRFVGVNRPVGATMVDPNLPDGWGLQDVVLKSAWRVDLFGSVRVLRIGDGASYQGPVGPPPKTAG